MNSTVDAISTILRVLLVIAMGIGTICVGFITIACWLG